MAVVGWNHVDSARLSLVTLLTFVSNKIHSHLPCIKSSASSEPLHGFHDLRTSSLYLRCQFSSGFDIPLIDISPPFLQALPGWDCSSRPSILCTRHIWIVVLLVFFFGSLAWVQYEVASYSWFSLLHEFPRYQSDEYLSPSFKILQILLNQGCYGNDYSTSTVCILINISSNERRRTIGYYYSSPSGRASQAPASSSDIVRDISSIFDGLHFAAFFFQVARAYFTTRVIHAYPQFRRSSVALYHLSRPYATPTLPIVHHRLCLQYQHRHIDDWFSCTYFGRGSYFCGFWRDPLFCFLLKTRCQVWIYSTSGNSIYWWFTSGILAILVIIFHLLWHPLGFFSWISRISWRFRFICDAAVWLRRFIVTRRSGALYSYLARSTTFGTI